MAKKVETFKLGDKKIIFEVGNYALQADASVAVSCGESVVLATVVASKKQSELDYFPLHVEYIERLYAGGRIKGSRWVKKEGRPGDEAVLAARLIDRYLRPLFPKRFKNDVQVVITLLSVDHEINPVDLSLLAASAAVHLSSIPWKGPVGVVRVGAKDNSFFVMPTEKEKELSDLDLVVAIGKEGVVMLEGTGKEVEEDRFFKAIEFGVEQGKLAMDFLDKLREKYGSEKMAFESGAPEAILVDKVRKLIGSQIKELVEEVIKEAGPSWLMGKFEVLVDEVKVTLDEEVKTQLIWEVVNKLFKKKLRETILSGKRPGSRKLNELRPLMAEVDLLPRTHGTGIFQRGFTKVLSVVTLGAPSLKQLIESPDGEESKRYMHQYSMLPYSVGETGRIGGFNRREIGHGALAEKALLPVIPEEDKFPYTIRVVSEILSSNGSTSMASVCGSTLALMDAGVPIVRSVAGISIGLIKEGEKFVLLTDIAGLEDFNGDMDFKVAGTKKGITAVQVDIKIGGLSLKIIEQTFPRAKKAREKILDIITKTIARPRSEISKYAPKISTLQIDKEKIGTVIGPGGKTIRRISEETECDIDVDDEGLVTITGLDQGEVDRALSEIDGLTREVEIGEELEGEVKRIVDFGAFIEFLPGRDGLVHVSKMGAGFIKHPGDVLKIGQKIKVRIREIDQMGRVNLDLAEPLPGASAGSSAPAASAFSRSSTPPPKKDVPFTPRR